MVLHPSAAPVQPSGALSRHELADPDPLLRIVTHLSDAMIQGHAAGVAVAFAALQTHLTTQPLSALCLDTLLAVARQGLHEVQERGWSVVLVPLTASSRAVVRVVIIDSDTHAIAVTVTPCDRPRAPTTPLIEHVIRHAPAGEGR